MDAPPPHGGVRLDAIRAQLKALGYLQGPLSSLEGWMLAGGGPSSFQRINVRASLRVALIGGPLLGVPAAAMVAISNRPHIVSPRDLLLLGLYLSSILGVALGGLEFACDTALASLARRGLVLVGQAERLAARVGLLFSVATTLYLACLVRGGRAALLSPAAGWGTERGAWVLWVMAVVGALAVGHLIGKLARIGSLMSLVAAVGGGDLVGRLGGLPARARAPLVLGLVTLLAVAGVLVFAPLSLEESSLRRSGAFERFPLAGRIILIGIDGLDAGGFDRLKPLGICPRLAGMEAEGARYDLRADAPRVPPAVWTTIATGRPSSQHGILGYQAERVPGMTAPIQETPGAAPLVFSLRLLLPPIRPADLPVSSGLRRARAVWEILTEGGLSTAAVNWWATWPAQDSDGLVVSERAFARLVAGQRPDRDTSPDSLQSDLASRFAADLETVHRRLAEQGGALDERVTTSAVIDGYHALVAQRLFRSGLAQVVFLYLPGLDIARARWGRSAADADQVLGHVLSNEDRMVGDLVDLARPEDLILVVGDPGRVVTGLETGLLLARGGRVLAGRKSRLVSPLDLAPTVLALAGFPMARDLPGRPVLDFVRVGELASDTPHPINSYGWRPEPLPGPAADPFDAEVLDRLRSLGYIQ